MACKSKHQGVSETVNKDQFDETRCPAFLDLLDHIGAMIALETLDGLKSNLTSEEECDETAQNLELGRKIAR